MPHPTHVRGRARRRALAAAALSSLLGVAACEASPSQLLDGGAGTSDAGQVSIDAGVVDLWLDAATADEDAGLPEEDAGPPSELGQGIFVAQGHAGRTVVSCDDGRTWHGDQSRDPSVERCFDGADCDHGAFVAKGIAYGRRGFVTVWGWGSDDGTIERSEDGVAWTSVSPQGSRPNHGGVVFSSSAFVTARRPGAVASTDGVTWEAAGELTGYATAHVRRIGAAHGRVFVYGDGGGDRDLMVSDDDGASWQRPELPHADCTSGIQNIGGFAELADAVVVAGSRGVVCTSTDGGGSWTRVNVASSFSSTLAVRDGEAWIYSRGEAHHSADGLTWTSEATSPGDLDLGAIGVSDAGTVVGMPGRRFQAAQWYDGQQIWRSEDGLTFDALDPSAYEGGHPIRFIAFGEVDATACE